MHDTRTYMHTYIHTHMHKSNIHTIYTYIHTYIHTHANIHIPDHNHRQKISHRDLKPENILLVVETNGSLVCKVADFGLSNDMVPGTTYVYICM